MSMVIALTYTALLFTLSSIPDNGETALLFALVAPKAQTLLHGVAYAILVPVWIAALRAHAVAERRSILIALALGSGCGVLSEVCQAWVPGRFPSVSDFMADMVGILLGSWLYWRLKRRVAGSW
jgi:VanZ family protein